jgi:hypothetical protein
MLSWVQGMMIWCALLAAAAAADDLSLDGLDDLSLDGLDVDLGYFPGPSALELGPEIPVFGRMGTPNSVSIRPLSAHIRRFIPGNPSGLNGLELPITPGIVRKDMQFIKFRTHEVMNTSAIRQTVMRLEPVIHNDTKMRDGLDELIKDKKEGGENYLKRKLTGHADAFNVSCLPQRQRRCCCAAAVLGLSDSFYSNDNLRLPCPHLPLLFARSSSGTRRGWATTTG